MKAKMLVNHVTEKTNPRKFAASHIRRQVRIIQDPYAVKISEASEAWRNSKGCFWNLIAYEEYVDIIREAEGDAYFLKPTEEEREREFKRKETEKIVSAINALRNGLGSIVAEAVSKAIGKS